jgi:hypothetical protein
MSVLGTNNYQLLKLLLEDSSTQDYSSYSGRSAIKAIVTAKKKRRQGYWLNRHPAIQQAVSVRPHNERRKGTKTKHKYLCTILNGFLEALLLVIRWWVAFATLPSWSLLMSIYLILKKQQYNANFYWYNLVILPLHLPASQNMVHV